MSLDQVRKRPGMYVGDTTDGSGLHRMVLELVDNAFDEALTGHCNRIEIVLNADGSVTVRDNGRGIPTDKHPLYQRSAAEIILTELHAGGCFGTSSSTRRKHSYGVGLAVVNALSSELWLRIWRHGTEYSMRFHQGEITSPLAVVGPAEFEGSKSRSGTEINFSPDASIFVMTEFQFQTVDNYARELIAGRSGATISLTDHRRDELKEVSYPS